MQLMLAVLSHGLLSPVTTAMSAVIKVATDVHSVVRMAARLDHSVNHGQCVQKSGCLNELDK